MQVTKNITAQEVLPKEIWDRYGSSGLRFMDPRIILAMQRVRERQGKPRYFNTWNIDVGFKRNESGLRIPGHTYYNETTMHKFGRALDSVSRDISHRTLWKDIVENPDWYWSTGITVIESPNVAPTWLHGDCRGYDYHGNPITELMIVDKTENGSWIMLTMEEWKEGYNSAF